jgi:hypothetical protein
VRKTKKLKQKTIWLTQIGQRKANNYMNSMEALRAKLLAANSKNEKTTSRSSGDNASFPFWDTPVGGSTTVRFLPDHADANNGFFWKERQTIKIPFSVVSAAVTSRLTRT